MTEPAPGGDPHVQALSADLLLRVEELGAELADRIRSVDPVYREGRIVTVDDLRETCRANLTLVFSRLAGSSEIDRRGSGADRPASRRTGHAAADNVAGLPHRWPVHLGGAAPPCRHQRRTKEALLQAAGDVWAIIDDYSEAVSEAFRDTIAEQARRDTQVRTAVLSSLLDGHLRDADEIQDAATVLQLPRQGSFVVVAAQTRGPGEEPLPRVEQILQRRDIASAWRLDDQYQIGILCLPPRLSVERVSAELAALAVACGRHQRAIHQPSTPRPRHGDKPRSPAGRPPREPPNWCDTNSIRLRPCSPVPPRPRSLWFAVYSAPCWP